MLYFVCFATLVVVSCAQPGKTAKVCYVDYSWEESCVKETWAESAFHMSVEMK